MPVNDRSYPFRGYYDIPTAVLNKGVPLDLGSTFNFGLAENPNFKIVIILTKHQKRGRGTIHLYKIEPNY